MRGMQESSVGSNPGPATRSRTEHSLSPNCHPLLHLQAHFCISLFHLQPKVDFEMCSLRCLILDQWHPSLDLSHIRIPRRACESSSQAPPLELLIKLGLGWGLEAGLTGSQVVLTLLVPGLCFEKRRPSPSTPHWAQVTAGGTTAAGLPLIPPLPCSVRRAPLPRAGVNAANPVAPPSPRPGRGSG